MARIISPVWSQIRGSIAGTTYLSNQFHQIVARQRTNPVQPNTNYQTAIRTALNAASVLWQGLTDDQRADWENYSATCQWPGPLGSYTIPGRQMFIAVHSMRLYLIARGIVFTGSVLTAPLVAGFLGIDSVAASSGPSVPGTGIKITAGNPNVSTIVVWANRSIAWNPSRLRFKGPWDVRWIDNIDVPTLTTGVIDFLSLSLGMRYFAIVRAISKTGPFKICAPSIVNALATTTAPGVPRGTDILKPSPRKLL